MYRGRGHVVGVAHVRHTLGHRCLVPLRRYFFKRPYSPSSPPHADPKPRARRRAACGAPRARDARERRCAVCDPAVHDLRRRARGELRTAGPDEGIFIRTRLLTNKDYTISRTVYPVSIWDKQLVPCALSTRGSRPTCRSRRARVAVGE